MSEVKVLIVEEEGTIRAFLQKLLQREGYRMAGFARADDAIAHLRDGYFPQVVIGNLQRPEGERLRELLAAHPLWSLVPLVSSAGDSQRLMERVREAAAARTPAPSDWDPVDFVAVHYAKMAEQLPGLLSRVRGLSEAAGVLDEVEASLDEAARGGRHIRSFVRYLRDYGHAAEEPRAPTDVTGALELALEIAQLQITSRARLVRELGPLPVVMAGARQLSHVFLSVLINGAQSIAEGNVEGNQLRVAARTDENGWAVVEIEDSGSGIAPEALPRIFEPYFSTKLGAGLGLGLHQCRAALTRWGGVIACVRTEPGKGSTFRVELPPLARSRR